MLELTRSEIRRYYAARCPDVRQTDQAEWRGPCPVHHGDDDNFAVNAETGRAHCHSQCDRGWDVFSLEQELGGGDFPEAKQRVFDALGKAADQPRKKAWDDRKPVRTYDYTDENGELLYQVVRYDPKDFKQRRRGDNGRWIWSIESVKPVPYHLPEVVRADMVFICEGEKDAETMMAHGLTATCNNGGAKKFRPELAPWFDGKAVCILPDNDEKGADHAITVANVLQPIAKTIKIVELPGLTKKGDVTDWFSAGGTVEQLRALYQEAPYYTPVHPEDRWVRSFSECVEDAGGVDQFWDFRANPGIPTPWTPLTNALRGGLQRSEVYGIIGDTGSGKTSMALQFGIAALRLGYGVGIFSLEMSRENVFQRMIAIEARVDLNEFVRRQLDGKPIGEEISRLQRAQVDFVDAPLWVSTKPAITPGYIAEETSRQKDKRLKLDLIIVDHMQLMSPDGRTGSAYEKATAISRALKQAATEIGLPILAVSQTSRSHGSSRRDELEVSDARDSGAIEEDMAGVMLLYQDREDVKRAKDEQTFDGLNRLEMGPIKTWLKLGKARYGVTGLYLPLDHTKRWTRFDLRGQANAEAYLRPRQDSLYEDI